MDPLLATIVVLGLIVPPLVLIAVQVERFLVGWFRGYAVREIADRPLGLSQQGRSGLPSKICPGCGQVIAAVAGECQYCYLRFDAAPRHRPLGSARS